MGIPPGGRRAIAGILAAIILFAMLFTVGTTYFLFLNQNNQLYSQAFSRRASATQDRLSENLLLNAFLLGNNLAFSVNNVGGLPVNITYVLISDSSGKVVAYYNKTISGISPSLPIYLNVGGGLSQVLTSVSYSPLTNYTLRVITYRGSVFSTTYPPSAQSLAAQALSSGAIGDLYLSFGSYTWYSVDRCPNDSSKYCLTPQGSAFSINYTLAKSSTGIAFAVQITNLNPSRANITLDQYSNLQLWSFKPGSQGAQSQVSFYIVNNVSNTISNTYNPITLVYNVPVTVVFASNNAGSFGTISASSVLPSGTSPPIIVNVFIISHGWKWTSNQRPDFTKLTTTNYGQNMPYVSTLFW